MIRVTPHLAIDRAELVEQFVRASGPGGQHVNKAATAVQLRFDVAGSPSLPDDVRRRLRKLAAGQINADGVLVIDARRYRSRERNRQDALGRLVGLLHQAAKPPKRRRRTRPTLASKRRRLESKRQQSEKKRRRRTVDPDSH